MSYGLGSFLKTCRLRLQSNARFIWHTVSVTPQRWRVAMGIAAMVTAGVMSQAKAQDLGIDLQADTQVEADNPDEWLKTRWSWLHEWEMHSRAYLLEPSLIIKPDEKSGDNKEQKSDQKPQRPAVDLDVARTMAVKSLVEVSQRGRPVELRVEATIALGRIGTPAAVERLFQLLNDQDDNVSEVAWMALGLVNTNKTREKLLDPGTLSSRQTLGWIVAIALMVDPPDNVMRTLAALVKQDRDLPVARMALWAMRHHNPPGLLDAARKIAEEAIDPVAASEALLIIGNNRNERDLSFLKSVLLTRGRGVIQVTNTIVESVTDDSPPIVNNYRGGLLSAVRASSAIALGQYVIAPEDKYSQRARDTLRMFFEEPPVPVVPVKGVRFRSDFTHSAALPYEIRLAASSLGRIGYAEDAELLIKIMRTTSLSDYRGRLHDARFYLRRGHAALALGTYLRRMTDLGIVMQPTDLNDPTTRTSDGDAALWRNHGPLEGEGPDTTRYILRKTLRSLIDVAMDRNEPYDLRAACVLALGMSNSPPRKQDIRAILQSPAGQDDVVAAYGVLALALLGDTQTLDLASTLLHGKNKKTPKAKTVDELTKHGFALNRSAGKIVITRALLQAIGKIESPVSIELARSSFGHEPWTSRQAVQTLRLLGDVSLVEPLSQLLDRYPELAAAQSKRGHQVPAPPTAGETAALSAWSLGQLLRPTLHDPLAELFGGYENYTLPLAPVMQDADELRKADATYRFRCYADPSFYEWLAPCLPPRVAIRFRF